MQIDKIGNIANVTKLAGFEYTKCLSGNFTDNGIPVIQGKNIKNHSLNIDDVKYIPLELSNSLPRSQVKSNDILFCYVANVGDCWLNDKNRLLHLGSNIAKITVTSDKMLPKYLYYWFQNKNTYDFINSISKGSVQKNVNMEEIRSLEVPVLSIDQQQHIIDIVRKEQLYV